MIAVTHLVLVLLLIKAFRLDRNEAFAALLFGVFIDLDHVFGVIDFLARYGWGNALNVNAALASDIQWKSMLHSPEGALFVVPVCVGFRWFVPILAWGLHLVMDYVQMTYLGIFSWPEIALLVGLALCLLYLEAREYEDHGHTLTFAGLMRWEAVRLHGILTDLPVVRSLKKWRGSRGTAG